MNPGHGTLARWQAGCDCTPCERAKKRYRIFWERAKEAGVELLVDAGPTHRRVRSLARHGWSAADIGKRLDPPISQQAMARIMKRPRIRALTAQKIGRVYAELEMRLAPETPWALRTKRAAERAGWPPPLEWEDIEAGTLADAPRLRLDGRFDETSVEHALQYHDFSIPLSVPEKCEVVRRWARSGRPLVDLESLTGWNVNRYREHNTVLKEA